MISIIVSSFNKDYFSKFSINVKQSIGVPFEIIQIWNPGLYSICEVYNRGAESAKFDYLIFCHEDIFFLSQNWGRNIIGRFESNPDLGAIGFAGSSYIPYNFTGWDSSYMMSKEGFHLIQHSKYCNKETMYLNVGNDGTNIKEVLALDGFFISVKRKIWDEFKFDEFNFKKFHFYDIDFTLRISEKYNVYVVYDIKTEHFSEGNYNKDWLDELRVFQKKWISKLPVYIGKKNNQIDLVGNYRYLYLTMNNKYSIYYYLRSLFSFKFITVVGLGNFMLSVFKFPIRYFRLRKNYSNKEL